MKLLSLDGINARVLALLTTAASMGLMACSGVAGTTEDVGSAQEAGLAMNGLSINAIVTSPLAMNELAANGLTANGVIMTSDIAASLAVDPLAQMLVKYVVSCALPPDQSLALTDLAGQTSLTFVGGMGLAPEWGTDGGACDVTCQKWVSACVISRVNYLGVHVPLSIRGANPGFELAPGEATTYPHREATYFGNVFLPTPELHACRAIEDDQTLIGRPCGSGADVSACGIDVLGDCHSVCGTLDPTTGAFGNCTTPTDGSFAPAVTVYRM